MLSPVTLRDSWYFKWKNNEPRSDRRREYSYAQVVHYNVLWAPTVDFLIASPERFEYQMKYLLPRMEADVICLNEVRHVPHILLGSSSALPRLNIFNSIHFDFVFLDLCDDDTH